MQRLVAVQWRTAGRRSHATGLLRDLSLRGMYLYLEAGVRQDLRPSTEIQCTLLFPHELPGIGGRPWQCTGTVVRTEHTPALAGMMGIGIELNLTGHAAGPFLA